MAVVPINIVISCHTCGHLNEFVRGFKGELECTECGSRLSLQGLSP